jgi:hypothetical protein
MNEMRPSRHASTMFWPWPGTLKYRRLQWISRTRHGVLRTSDRDVVAEFDDVFAREAEEIADVHGVTLHRGEKRLLPFCQALPVLPANDRFVADVIGDVVEIEGAALRPRLP